MGPSRQGPHEKPPAWPAWPVSLASLTRRSSWEGKPGWLGWLGWPGWLAGSLGCSWLQLACWLAKAASWLAAGWVLSWLAGWQRARLRALGPVTTTLSWPSKQVLFLLLLLLLLLLFLLVLLLCVVLF